jgi:site-specific recombinase XerD
MSYLHPAGLKPATLNRATVWLMMQKYGKAAGLDNLAIHPHMFRHACGYDLANRGNDTRLMRCSYFGWRCCR